MITHHKGPFVLCVLGPRGYIALQTAIRADEARTQALGLLADHPAISIWSEGENQWIWNVRRGSLESPQVSEGYLVAINEQIQKKWKSSGTAVSKGRKGSRKASYSGTTNT